MEQQHRPNSSFDVQGPKRETSSREVYVQDARPNPCRDIKRVGEIPGRAEEIVEGPRKGNEQIWRFLEVEFKGYYEAREVEQGRAEGCSILYRINQDNGEERDGRILVLCWAQ